MVQTKDVQLTVIETAEGMYAVPQEVLDHFRVDDDDARAALSDALPEVAGFSLGGSDLLGIGVITGSTSQHGIIVINSNTGGSSLVLPESRMSFSWG